MAVPHVTELGKKMVARADRDKLPENHPLRTLAAEFDDASAKYLANPQKMGVRAFMGFWARARKAWCQHTGDALL